MGKDKSKGGRPTKYRPEMCDDLAAFGTGGEGTVEACQMLGISKATFHNWAHEHPEFLDAINSFKLNSQVWWERKGRDGMTGKISGFNATSFIFQMKNRFSEDWRDRKEHDVSSSDGTMSPARPEMTDEEFQKELEARGLPPQILEE